MKLRKSAFPVLLLLCIAASSLFAQDLASFEKRVTVQKLPNGLTVVLCRRPEAPVFAFNLFVDAGSAQDPKGETGIAHMMEHMAFKGTPNIGTKDWPKEKVALAKVEVAYAAYEREKLKRVNRNDKLMMQLEESWKKAVADANQYVIPNQFGQIVEREGGAGMNAETAEDETQYFYSMPINRLQLWAYLESDRLMHPVMREFYKERDVVIEERRMRTDSSPIGRLVEQFQGTAFTGSPYHRPTIGYQSDLDNFSATDAQNFYHRYYVPSNMVLAVVGDIDPKTALPIIDKYLGRIPSGPKPEEYATKDAPQNSERQILLHDPSQPFYLEGYHRPSYLDPDDAVYDAISDILSNGRTSRLYRSLVRDKKIAAEAAGFSGFPGTKYPHLFAFYAVPMPGHTPDEMRTAIHEEIDKLKTTYVTDEELAMMKTRAKAALIRSLDSNSGLASMLSIEQARYGDWRELFREVDRIEKVTKEDIKRVANKTFTDNNRTVGILETAPLKNQKEGQ
jgi:predicted Zn-dependent peptidase